MVNFALKFEMTEFYDAILSNVNTRLTSPLTHERLKLLVKLILEIRLHSLTMSRGGGGSQFLGGSQIFWRFSRGDFNFYESIKGDLNFFIKIKVKNMQTAYKLISK